jgi:uncharacterized membrane protein (UPF0127 family)
MTKSRILVGVLLLALAGAASWIVFRSDRQYEDQLCSPKECYSFERSASEAARRQGLSGRESLCSECAMLFEFESAGRHGFWMRGMKFPLDIVWLDREGRTVHIERRLEPDDSRTYVPPTPAWWVVELNADAARDVALGDRWRLPTR